MTYGTDNDLSRPQVGANGIPVAGGNVIGQFSQGQPTSQPATQPYHAPAIAPAATAPHNYQVPNTYQPTHQPVTQPVTSPIVPAGVGAPPVPVFNPTSGQWELPQATPVFSGVPQPVPNPVPTPAPVPTAQPVAPVGNNYIETSINHLTTSLGVNADAFDKVIEAAIQYGDVNLINPNALGVQLTPEQQAQVTSLAQGAVQYIQAETAAENARVDNLVYGVAGGKDAWTAASNTFASVADANTKSYIGYLVSAGQHEQAAKIVIQTVRNLGYQPQGQAPIQASAVAGQQGLTSAAFKDALGKLRMEAGNNSLESGIWGEKFQNLNQLRALGRQQGLA